MADADYNALTDAQIQRLITQMFDFPKFWLVNAHIPEGDRQQIRLDAIQGSWPQYIPIFNAYATTKGDRAGYGQIRLTDASTPSGGTKFYCHRLTYRQMYGPVLDSTEEISHTHYCGAGNVTSRNINPRHLVQEEADVNKARRGCHLFFKMKIQDDMDDFRAACAPDDNPDEDELVGRKEVLVRGWKRDMNQCKRVHRHRNCGVLIDSVWAQDYGDDTDISVEENLETRAESQVRLSSPVSEIPDSTRGSSQYTILPVRSSSRPLSSPQQSDDDYEDSEEDSEDGEE